MIKKWQKICVRKTFIPSEQCSYLLDHFAFFQAWTFLRAQDRCQRASRCHYYTSRKLDCGSPDYGLCFPFCILSFSTDFGVSASDILGSECLVGKCLSCDIVSRASSTPIYVSFSLLRLALHMFVICRERSSLPYALSVSLLMVLRCRSGRQFVRN